MGTQGQPDFARVTVSMSIQQGGKCPELKSIKEYFLSFRGAHVSYERIVDIMWEDLNKFYSPMQICVEIETNTRGGISSRVWCGEEVR